MSHSPDDMENASPEEIISALFANMVIQQTNMAFMFLGRVPHPETGELMHDLEHAQFFISQLEMLEVKTKGNLNPQEESLLKQSLTNLRMAFVEAVDRPAELVPKASAVHEASTPMESPEAKAAEDESRKKFSKKY